MEATDSPAALRRTLDAAELTYLASYLLDEPGLTTHELRAEVAALDLGHTGDLPARLRAYVEHVDMTDSHRDRQRLAAGS